MSRPPPSRACYLPSPRAKAFTNGASHREFQATRKTGKFCSLCLSGVVDTDRMGEPLRFEGSAVVL